MPAEPTKRGAFITVEGGDGAGKTTLARALAACLVDAGHQVRLTFEPGGTELGNHLRALVLDPDLDLSDWEETWLFLAARASHVSKVIRPALQAGEIVISDRYADSTLAYQGFGRGLDIERLRRVNDQATQGLMPDLTLLLDLPAAVGLQRTRSRTSSRDRIGDAALGFHEQVNAGFRELANVSAGRVIVIDADRDVTLVRAAALKTLREWLDERLGGEMPGSADQ